MFKSKHKEKPKPISKSEDNKSNKKGVTQSVVIEKTPSKRSKAPTFETFVVTEEAVELFEHRITHWQNDTLISDVRKLLAKPLDGPIQQKIVTTEKLSIPQQSLVVPIRVNKQIGNEKQDSTIVGVPVIIKQLDVPVIETVEVIEVPIKTIKRTTQTINSNINQSNDKKPDL